MRALKSQMTILFTTPSTEHTEFFMRMAKFKEPQDSYQNMGFESLNSWVILLCLQKRSLGENLLGEKKQFS